MKDAKNLESVRKLNKLYTHYSDICHWIKNPKHVISTLSFNAVYVLHYRFTKSKVYLGSMATFFTTDTCTYMLHTHSSPLQTVYRVSNLIHWIFQSIRCTGSEYSESRRRRQTKQWPQGRHRRQWRQYWRKRLVSTLFWQLLAHN